MKNNDIEQYCTTHSEIESTLQKEIREYTYKNERYPCLLYTSPSPRDS